MLEVRADGRTEGLGQWIERTEGAKFRLNVFNELRNRGLEDGLVAVNGLRDRAVNADTAAALDTFAQDRNERIVQGSPPG